MPTGVHHFAIQVRDLGAAERFYRDVLGFIVRVRWPAAASPESGGDAADEERSLWLDVGEEAVPAEEGDDTRTFVALERVPGGTAPTAAEEIGVRAERPGHHLVAFRIAASERPGWELRLRTAGVAVTHRTRYTLYFADPEGNRLALSHYPVPNSADDPESWPR